MQKETDPESLDDKQTRRSSHCSTISETIAETIEWMDRNLAVDRDYQDFRVWKLDRFDPMKGGAIVFDGTFLCVVGRSESSTAWHRVGLFPKTIEDIQNLLRMTDA